MNCEICSKEISDRDDRDTIASINEPHRHFHSRCLSFLRCSHCKRPIADLRDWVNVEYHDKSKPGENYHFQCYYELTGDDLVSSGGYN